LLDRQALQLTYAQVDPCLGTDGYGNSYFLLPLRNPLDFTVLVVLCDEFFNIAASTLTNALLSLRRECDGLKPRKVLVRGLDGDEGNRLGVLPRERTGLRLLRISESVRSQAAVLLQVKRFLLQSGFQLVVRGSRARKGDLATVTPHPRVVELQPDAVLEMAKLLCGEEMVEKMLGTTSPPGDPQRSDPPVEQKPRQFTGGSWGVPVVDTDTRLAKALVKAYLKIQEVGAVRERLSAEPSPARTAERVAQSDTGLYALMEKLTGLPRWATYTNAALDGVPVFGNLKLAHGNVDAAMDELEQMVAAAAAAEAARAASRNGLGRAGQEEVKRGRRRTRTGPRGSQAATE